MPSEETAQFPTEYEEKRERMLELLRKGNPQEAYSILLSVLDYPMEITNELVFKDALNIFEKIAIKISGKELGDLVRNVIDDVNDIQALFDLSYELYEESQHGLAATFLSRANKIEPQDAHIVPELVSNLEELMLNDDARRILIEAEDLLDESELCRYLLAYNTLMTGDLDEPREILKTLQHVEDEDLKSIVESFEGMLNRARYLKDKRPLDNKDLRGWHAVLNGTLLLHCSPYGDDSMNGRYAYMADSYALCREGIERVSAVIKEAGIKIPCVYSLQNRSSKILALATSEILGIPLKQWNGDLEPGLIVVYDMEEIESEDVLIQIADHQPGQVLWAHASCWTYPFPISPDITTFLYQMKTSPWDGGMIYDSESEDVWRADPDESPLEVIANKIKTAVKDDRYLDDFDDVISIMKELKDIKDEHSQLGIFKSQGRRNRQRIGSPVPSNRFL